VNNRSAALLDDALLEAAAQSITPLPAATSRLLTVATAPDVAVNTVVEIVRYDPALTGALLRQANSAYSMVVRRITDVHDAVVRLGIDNVVTVAMRTAVAASMKENLDLYDLEGKKVYRHAVLAAVAAEVLRSGHPSKIPPITPTVALLHDVGKIVLSRAVGARAVHLVSVLSQSDGRPLFEIEREVFGVHHAQAGRQVVQAWKLPHSFLEGIVNHHCDIETPSMFARSVQLSNELAHVAEGVLEGSNAPTTISEAIEDPTLIEAADSLRIDTSTLATLADMTVSRYELIAPTLDL
jgi:HD-like signal output (HDOD) protein